jgi:hypothetical protein
VSVNSTVLEEAIDTTPIIGYDTSLVALPSKVRSLLDQLKSQPPEVKW